MGPPAGPAAPGDEGAGPLQALEGVVARVTYRNPENHYTVLRLELTEGGLATVVGLFPGVEAGERIRARGGWTVHPTYGRQFKADSFQPLQPVDAAGVERYLASGAIPGVGPALARRLVERFGDETLEVMESQPHRLQEVPGIGRKKAAAIAASTRARKASRAGLLFLQGHGVTPGLAARIVRQYGDETVRLIRENPYRLADEVWGIGFRRADEIARNLNFPADSPLRAQSALLHVLREAASEGHVCLPRRELEQRVQAFDGLLERTPAALEALRAAGRVVVEEWDEPMVYLAHLHRAETGVAEAIRSLSAAAGRPLEASGGGAASPADGLRLSPAQEEAIRLAGRHRLLLLTGGPGTGKTTVVRAIVRSLEAAGETVRLAAPTGRAAQRLREAAGAPASTIHRLLEVTGGAEGEGPRFQRNAQRPLSCDALIVDEVSMLDVPLAHRLLQALRPGARLILVGDPDQLPSVGPGQLLQDLLDAGAAPTVRLVEIFRQAQQSQIILNAHRIKAGRMPVSGGEGGDFFFMEEPAETLPERVEELVAERLPAFLGTSAAEIQVLAAVRRGPSGVEALNQRLQDRLNPFRGVEVQAGSVRLRPGDRVMQTRNDYQKMVFNGDVGRVRAVRPAERLVEVEFPESDEPVVYEEDELEQLTPAYAISVHKSQGSEHAAVVMPITSVMPALMTRNLLYTALTRAKRLAVLVGSRSALRQYVRNQQAGRRHSMLAARLGAGR